MHVSKRNRSFLRPDKRSMGSVKISKAFAFAMKDVIGASSASGAEKVLDTDKATAYKQQNGKKYGNSKGHYDHG